MTTLEDKAHFYMHGERLLREEIARTEGFDICVADPPWKFTSNSQAKPGKNAMGHYPCMTVTDICDLPVREMMAEDALLLLWTTAPFLEASFRVVDAWGFKYKTNLVWDKERPATGFWVRGEHEHVLICRRGKFPTPDTSHRRRSVIRGGRREHSRKPDDLQDWVDAAWPDARKVELFARQTRPGWTAWGNETGKFGMAA